jgi:periplasmic protein TonB
VKTAVLSILLIGSMSADLKQRGSPPIVHVSEHAGDHRIVSRVQPFCPDGACSLCAHASVKLQVFVSRSGNVKGVVLLNGAARLEEAAINAVRQWRYDPYLVGGQPVEYETRTTLASWTCKN